MILKVLVCKACNGTGGQKDDCFKCRGIGRYRETYDDSVNRKDLLQYKRGHKQKGGKITEISVYSSVNKRVIKEVVNNEIIW